MTKCVRCKRPLKNPITVQAGYGPICWTKMQGGAKKSVNEKQRGFFEADFDFKLGQDAVIIYDLDLGGKSVTNDIENVLKKIKLTIPNLFDFKVIYKDSLGTFDQVIIDEKGDFKDFKYLGALSATAALKKIKKVKEQKHE